VTTPTKYCQAYFSYDSKKSGGFTCSHLRFGDTPIRSTYLVNTPNFVACHVQAYLHMYDVLRGIRQNGTFLLNTIWTAEELVKHLPNNVKRTLAQKNISFYTINATKIAQEIGLGNRTNTILQSAFFRITEVIPVDLAIEQMKKFIVKSYGKKGEDVVNKNYAAVDRGGEYEKVTVDAAWANLPDDEKAESKAPEFVENVVKVINAQPVMTCLFLHSLESKTELGLPEPLNMKNAVFLLSSLFGTVKTVYNVTSALTFVLMLLSVRSSLMKPNWPLLLTRLARLSK